MITVAYILVNLYGVINGLLGVVAIKPNRIQRWAVVSWILSGLLLVTAAIFILIKSMAALVLLIIGLIAIHLLAINNGLKLHGKITPSHHIIRLVISIGLILVTFYAIQS